MNNTTKAKYDMAEKMLKGHIAVDEVVLMSGLSKEEVQTMYEQIENSNPEAKYFKNLDFKDFDLGRVIIDDYDDLDTSDGSNSETSE